MATNKISLKTLYDYYATLYKPRELEALSLKRENRLTELYHLYAEDYRKGEDGQFFVTMLRAIDEGQVSATVFNEAEDHSCNLFDTHLCQLVTEAKDGQCSLLALLRNTLSIEDFSIKVECIQHERVMMIVYWSLNLAEKIS